MRYTLLNPVNPEFSAIETVLTNRGIAIDDIHDYLNTTDEVISDPTLLGETALRDGYEAICAAINQDLDCLVIVDSDCDGFTSSAVLINYLHDWNPEWVENHLTYHMHSGKQHGLADVEVPDGTFLVIVPDAGSNDYEQHKALRKRGMIVLVLDHHEAEYVSEDAIIINNQMSEYPNKQLSGVGVTWQFCRYIDRINATNYADQYIDMVALGLDADMMSLLSLETKHLINKGLDQSRVKNPFFYSMKEKNAFSLKGKLTPIGVAFYIAPFVNSMVRSGTIDEKVLLFKSMLKHEAFKRIPSTKLGCKGQEETLVEQAVRTATNVKNRQTRSQEAGLNILESMITNQNLLDDKVLLFLCEPGKVAGNIAGLVANKFMSKYQRNVAILFPKEEEDGTKIWRGSARGYGKSTIESFKDLCAETGVIEYAQGHANAFGLGIKDENIQKFLELTNEALANDIGEATYYVDYLFMGQREVEGEFILDISRLDNLWGQDMSEALVAIEGLKITSDMLTLMSADKNPTIKITLSNRVSILKFKSSQTEYEKLLSETGYVEINLVGTCNANEWMGNVTPQLFIKDYEVVGSNKYIF